MHPNNNNNNNNMTTPPPPFQPIHLVYDDRMLLHKPIGWRPPAVFPQDLEQVDDDYPIENPQRLRVVYQRICQLEQRLLDNQHSKSKGKNRKNTKSPAPPARLFQPLSCEMACREHILLAHSEDQYDKLNELEHCTDEELLALSLDKTYEVYYCRESFRAARLATGGVLACVDAVCDAKWSNQNHPQHHHRRHRGHAHHHQDDHVMAPTKSLALVRPPGHHACQSQEMGFCFIDSVVVAAKYALATKKAKRVCILDWDIHDGNGTSQATIRDDNIFRIDLHRLSFYPYTGSPHDVGDGRSRGLNLNLGWTNEDGGMGNVEYAAAFCELILPLLVDFAPDLLLISCGLDAAKGDLLGGCKLTADFYHAMTRATLEALPPATPVVCILEGGYTMSVLPDCIEAVALALINSPYKNHSELRYGGSAGLGALEEHPSGDNDNSHAASHWPKDRLGRSRKVLSRYYTRGGKQCSLLLHPTAIHDINTSIRIFNNIARWDHVTLQSIKDPHARKHNKHNNNKKRKTIKCGTENSASTTNHSFYLQNHGKRPRIYLWYGTELHHQNVW